MANNNTAPATKVIVPCRISFANIWEPKSINGSDEKYSVSLLIPKDDKTTLVKIKKAIEAAKEAAKEKKWNGKIPANLKLPMHDGDIDRPDDENYAGHFFFNATSKDAPQIVVGERLIRYFSLPCKPTKANGGRTRNLPEHAPEDWKLFKSYCIQDVETERDIRRRLEKFPLMPQEWDYYHMDQRINDRGILIDKELVSMKALDYLDMPECVYVNHEVEMNAVERKLYDQLKHDLIIPLEDGDIDAANAASLSNKLLQMANGAVYDENKEARTIHSRKLEMLEDLIEAANGQPVLIGYWFKHDRTRIIEHLTACGYAPRDIKDSSDITDWNNGSIPVALIHPASAGHGLNIQSGGHILIWFGLTWSLELYQQTNARLWRQGQQNTVTIHHIVTKDTVDEDVLKALASKDVTQEKLIAAVKARL